VLRQIKLPHSYYYREMYLPQVTSGPGSPAWSPDGKTLVYSMQGSLWRQRLGDSVAEQITTGGYDAQPDWSPDGRHLVYSSYCNDQVQLWLLDLESLDARPLIADGAVNLEPRWAPDGKRIAFVSTAYEGRFHVFLAELGPDLTARPPVRLTPDQDSGLPRYYYSRFDHYLSPSWSPDGRELLLISNRGHIWGTGGFWRMEARPDAPLREIRYEETTWKARPDWAPDGKRVVYSGYYGRQWNQLWLMTAEGGDAFQLTYGDFDATEPRWSPDGGRIAYISNETGNPSLWVVTVPGGRRERVESRRRIYRDPVGRLRLTVVDQQGRLLPSRISITLPDGRSVAPDEAWRHADDSFVRKERAYEYGYFHTTGSADLTVPAGTIRVEASHGPEYQVARRSIRIQPDSAVSLRIVLERIADLRLVGWTAGDLHVHMNYGGHYRATPATLALQAKAEGLQVVENLIVNKEGRIPDVAYFGSRPDPVSGPDFLLVHDQEFHTSYWGHLGLLGLRQHLVLPGYAAYANTPAASLYPDNAAVADLAHAQGGLAGYVHPFDEVPDPRDTSVALTDELPVDVALGKVDYYEVMGFSDHLASSAVWYRLLNCGFRLPAGAGTDAMSNFVSLRGPVGTNRVYVQSGFPLRHDAWLGALRAGKTFVTNGPLLEFTLNSQAVGQEIRLPPGRHVLRARISVRSMVPLDHVEIIGNGVVVATVPLTHEGTSADASVEVPVDRSGWFILRARAEHPREPILDAYPYASTSPIYLTLGDQPPRSRADADYFLAWLDRLEAAVGRHQDWNNQAERREVEGHLDAARRVFEVRRQVGP
jgi:Tol biopolymer transport system component